MTNAIMLVLGAVFSCFENSDNVGINFHQAAGCLDSDRPLTLK